MSFTLLRAILIGTALLVVVENSGAVRVAPQEDAAAQRMEARKWLNEGVQAYREGQIDQAIVDFQNAKQLDPSLVNAQLYLATARSAQYIPGERSARRPSASGIQEHSRSTSRQSVSNRWCRLNSIQFSRHAIRPGEDGRVEVLSSETHRTEAWRSRAVLLGRRHRLVLGVPWQWRHARGFQQDRKKAG